MNDEIKIEKGVPLPRAAREPGYWVGILRRLEPGDSFLVATNSERESARVTAKRQGIKIVSRRVGDGWRIWRAE